MALTEEQLKLQMEILTSRTSDNPDMTYKAVAALNKALNPDIFTSNNTKIVNAINLIAAEVKNATNLVTDLNNKLNAIILDTDTMNGQSIWDHVKELAGKDTIIEGIENILSGNRQEQILNLQPEDVGHVLVVHQEDNGDLITKAIDSILLSHMIDAHEVDYTNEMHPEINNIKDAIDMLLAKDNGSIAWDAIENKPDIANKLVLEEGNIVLMANEKELSSIQITIDEDIDNIINNLN